MKDMIRTVLLATIVGAISGALAARLAVHQLLHSFTTNQLVIVDQAERKRAVLAVDMQGRVALDMFDENNKPRVSVGVSSGENFAKLPANEHRSRMWSPWFKLYDEDGKESAVLTAAPRGNAALEFYDRKGFQNVGLGYLATDNDAGRPQNFWGFRATDGNALTAVGIYGDKTATGAKYIAPALDGFGLRSHFEWPDRYVSPSMQPHAMKLEFEGTLK